MPIGFSRHTFSRALACCVAGTKDGLFLHKGNKGGLALWQLERATEIIEAHIGRPHLPHAQLLGNAALQPVTSRGRSE